MEGKENNGPQQVDLILNGLSYSGELTRDENGEWSGELWNPELSFISNGLIKVEKGVLEDGALLWGEIDNGLSTYAGAIKGGKRSGKGELRVRDGTGTGVHTVIMRGEFKDSTFLEGTREAHYNNGSIRSEEWHDKKPSGQGRWDHPGGYYEVGKFVDDKLTEGNVRMVGLDGSIYEGGWKNGRREGYGKVIDSLGNTYRGDWKNGHSDGWGWLRAPSGDYWRGKFVGGKFTEGKVRFTNPDGSLYEGKYSGGKYEGYGKLTYSNGCSAEGEFVNGEARNVILERKLPDGRLEFSHIIFDWNGNVLLREELGVRPNYKNGKLDFSDLDKLKNLSMEVPAEGGNSTTFEDGETRIAYADDNVYVGKVDGDGKPDGKGIWIGPGGESRGGTFEKGRFMEGDVAMKLSKNITYIGKYKNGEFDGEGKLVDANGEVFRDGTFENGKFKDGKAIAHNLDGSTYDGPMKDRVANGYGKLLYLNGDNRVGNFMGGFFSGNGFVRITSSDGSVHGGFYRYGKPDGWGRREHPGGDYEDGYFENSYFSGNGNVRKTDPSDGSVYEGEYFNKLRHGYGKITHKNGCSMEGMFGYGLAKDIVLERKLPNDRLEFSHIIFDRNGNVLLKEKLEEKPKCVDKKIDFSNLGKLKKPPMVVPAKAEETKTLEGRKVRIIYAYDSIYTGEVDKDGKPNGKGEWTVPGEESREGTFKNGEFIEGDVVMKLNSDVTYRVEYKDGKFIGNGKLKEKDGEYCECETSKANVLLKEHSEKKPPMVVPAEAEETKTLEGGKMEIIYEDDSIYVGRVGVDGKPHGRGTWVDAEKKELRQGEFARGNFVGGEVVMELSDNISYAGGYRNGKFDGMGELKSKDGEYYKKGRFGDNILIDGSLNIISLDGSIHKADIKDDGSLSGTNVEIFHLNGNYESGEFLRGSLYNGKIRTTYPNGSSYDGEYSNGLRSGYGIVTYKNGDIAEGESLNGKPLGMFTKSKGSNIYRHEAYDNEGRLASHEMLSKTPVRLGGEENRFEMNAKREPIWKEIYSYDSGIMKDSIILYPPSKDGIPEKTIEIDFNLANALLSSGEATDLEGLVAKGVLVAKDREGQRNLSGVSSSEIRGLLTDAAKKMAEIRASKGADGFSGGFPLEAQAMMLSMVGNRNLKNLRFCTKKTSHTTSMTSFLESIGMNRQNLKDSKEDHIIIHMVTDTGDHAVCFLVNLKRLREVGWDKLDASNEIFINFFDSSRAVGNENYKGSFGGIRKNCRPLGQAQQEKGNCWLQAIAAELMALENPEVVGRVLSRENPTYEPNERVFLGAGDIPNEFALKQLLKLQEVVDTLAVKLDGDIPLVESIIVGHLKDRIAELAEGEKLLAELDNRIEEAFEIFGEKLKKLEGGVSELEDEEYRKRKEEITKKYKDKLSKVINDISGDSKKTPSTEGAEDEKSKEKAKELPKLIKNLKTFVVAGEEINKQADELASRLELTLEKFREAREKANGLAEEELKLANLLESTANLLEEKTELSPTLPSPLLQS